jgi:hypothetical protein
VTERKAYVKFLGNEPYLCNLVLNDCIKISQLNAFVAVTEDVMLEVYDTEVPDEEPRGVMLSVEFKEVPIWWRDVSAEDIMSIMFDYAS